MTVDRCAELRLLVQADVDGELTAAEAARVAAHLPGCPGCTALQADLLGLRARLRDTVPRHAAPSALRDAVRARVDSAVRPRRWGARLVPFGAGFALAASVAVALMLPRGDALQDSIVAAHVRALQPGHLVDVASTDQHTVKPWFDGRLDFAPAVPDFAGDGFPLQGGRLDYLGGRPVAVLVYQHRLHVIEVYAWPGSPATATRSTITGYNIRRWSQSGMALTVISDLNPEELAAFITLWQRL